jgi:phosphatidylglycerophosphatase A
MKPVPAKFLFHPVHAVALGLGAGFAPVMPGTAGTLVGVLLYIPLQSLSWPWYVAVTLLMLLAGIAICGITAAALEVHDHPAIVWDEIVGYLITMIAAPPGWVWMATGFVLFRLFDIWKPWPIKIVDKSVPGGLGIMADDVIAATYGWLLMYIIHILYLVSVVS